jgi:hypothetical protein
MARRNSPGDPSNLRVFAAAFRGPENVAVFTAKVAFTPKYHPSDRHVASGEFAPVGVETDDRNHDDFK